MELSNEHKEIFVIIGVTLHGLQAVEKLIRLVMTYAIQKDPPLTLEKMESLQEKDRAKTLGYFLSELHKRADLDDSFDKTLSNFLSMRNQFVHNHDEISGWCLDTDEGRRVAHQFLAEFNHITEVVMLVFAGVLRSWQAQNGM